MSDTKAQGDLIALAEKCGAMFQTGGGVCFKAADWQAFAAALRSPGTQEGEPSDERAAFEAWRRRTTKMDPDGAVALHGFGDDAGYANKITRVMYIGWMARAALAQEKQS